MKLEQQEFNFKNVDKVFEKIQKSKVDALVAKKFGETTIQKKNKGLISKIISKIRK